MLRILLIGNQGQLGYELERALAPLGEVQAVDYPAIDLSNPEATRALVQDTPAQVIINATAYTAVDRAESEPELAFAINAQAPGILAEAARRSQAAFIHFSTDYVFDGQTDTPYMESAPTNPLGVYGKSKLAGEQAVEAAGGAYLILRTAWVYSLRRASFVTKVLEWARKNPELRVVADQISNPTWARMLAEITALLVARSGESPAAWLGERSGLYHLAGDGYASRLEWAKAILSNDPHKETQVAREILPARTADFPTPAQRPLFSALDCTLFQDTFGLGLPDWREALKLSMDTN